MNNYEATARIDLLVCICTYQRLSVLSAVESACAQNVPANVSLHVLVIDNDASSTAEITIRNFNRSRSTSVGYKHAPGANISIARNAALDAAAQFDWLALLDDDEVASYDWIATLLGSSGDSTNAVFGPCRAIYPEQTPTWIKKGNYHSCLITRSRNGDVTTGHTSNVLIDMRFVRTKQLRFDPALGTTGGEDIMFFRRMFQLGGRLHYAKEAVVYEDVPVQRLNAAWLIRRKYRIGQTHAMMIQKFESVKYEWLAPTSVVKVLCCLAVSAATMVYPPYGMWWFMRGVFHLGVASYRLGGAVVEEYKKPRTAT